MQAHEHKREAGRLQPEPQNVVRPRMNAPDDRAQQYGCGQREGDRRGERAADGVRVPDIDEDLMRIDQVFDRDEIEARVELVEEEILDHAQIGCAEQRTDEGGIEHDALRTRLERSRG